MKRCAPRVDRYNMKQPTETELYNKKKRVLEGLWGGFGARDTIITPPPPSSSFKSANRAGYRSVASFSLPIYTSYSFPCHLYVYTSERERERQKRSIMYRVFLTCFFVLRGDKIIVVVVTMPRS
jgi:hypothetical protein